MQGPDIAIHHPDSVLSEMNSWCIEHHGDSGLTQRCRDSSISMEEAESQVGFKLSSALSRAGQLVRSHAGPATRSDSELVLPTLLLACLPLAARMGGEVVRCCFDNTAAKAGSHNMGVTRPSRVRVHVSVDRLS